MRAYLRWLNRESGSLRRWAGPVLPCGVADPGGRTGFVSNAHGGIDGLDLATGELRWEVDGAKRPALADDDRVFAWTPVNANKLARPFLQADGRRPALDGIGASDISRLGPYRARAGVLLCHPLAAGKGTADPGLGARAGHTGVHATPEVDAKARKFAEGQARNMWKRAKRSWRRPSNSPRRPACPRNWKRRRSAGRVRWVKPMRR